MYLYSSLSSDSPNLSNTWGDFNNVINYVIDGGSDYVINKIEPYDEKKVKIYYDNALIESPWIANQTIEVSGSSKNYNKRFFIESVHDGEKFIICYNSEIELFTSEVEFGEADTITARVPGCGATRIFGGVDEQRTVFKFSEGIEYRIDDRNFADLLTPKVSFNNNWAKVARVCMSESFDSLDYTTKKMWPYTSARPSENFTPTGNYIGQAFVIYNESSAEAVYITYTSSKGSNRYKILANDKVMYIQVFVNNNYNNNNSYFYIFGSFDQIDKSIDNGIMHCIHHNGTNNTYTQTTTAISSYSDTHRLRFTYNPANRNFQCMNVWNDGTDTVRNIFFYGGFGYGAAQPSGNGGLRYPNLPNSMIYFSDAQVIDTSSNYLGNLYDVLWINSSYRPTVDSTFIINNELYICIHSFDSATMIKLDRP